MSVLLWQYKPAMEVGLIYGHLHGSGHRLIKEGNFEGVNLVCVSSDYVDFDPVRIG